MTPEYGKLLNYLCVISDKVTWLQKDLLDVLQQQQDFVKVLAAELPNLPPDFRHELLNAAALIGTAIEHESAGLAAFQEAMSKISKGKDIPPGQNEQR